MNKQELLEKINLLLSETKVDEANAKNRVEEAYCVGKQNGLLWAKMFIIELEESK